MSEEITINPNKRLPATELTVALSLLAAAAEACNLSSQQAPTVESSPTPPPIPTRFPTQTLIPNDPTLASTLNGLSGWPATLTPTPTNFAATFATPTPISQQGIIEVTTVAGQASACLDNLNRISGYSDLFINGYHPETTGLDFQTHLRPSLQVIADYLRLAYLDEDSKAKFALQNRMNNFRAEVCGDQVPLLNENELAAIFDDPTVRDPIERLNTYYGISNINQIGAFAGNLLNYFLNSGPTTISGEANMQLIRLLDDPHQFKSVQISLVQPTEIQQEVGTSRSYEKVLDIINAQIGETEITFSNENENRTPEHQGYGENFLVLANDLTGNTISLPMHSDASMFSITGQQFDRPVVSINVELANGKHVEIVMTETGQIILPYVATGPRATATSAATPTVAAATATPGATQDTGGGGDDDDPTREPKPTEQDAQPTSQPPQPTSQPPQNTPAPYTLPGSELQPVPTPNEVYSTKKFEDSFTGTITSAMLLLVVGLVAVKPKFRFKK